MYDIHCHILPEVDDGPINIDEAVQIAYAAEQAGIKGIVCTPHYEDVKYRNTIESNKTKLNKLREAIKGMGVGLELYLGNEVFITPELLVLLDRSKIMTLNDTRYILIEIPFQNKPLFTDDIIFQLNLRGLVPVIAHPERYEWVMKKPKELGDMIRKGCLMQLNMASIGGYYGNAVKRTANALIREKHIHLIGSDCHSSKAIYEQHRLNFERLQHIASSYEVERMIENNRAAIDNHIIKIH